MAKLIEFCQIGVRAPRGEESDEGQQLWICFQFVYAEIKALIN